MRFSIFYCPAVIAVSVVFYGCGSPAGSDSTNPQNLSADAGGNGGHADHSHGDHAHGDHEHDGEEGLSDMEKMKAVLAKLSPEDAASAEKQHFCPVSGDMLGAMGAPIKVDVNGQQVWICCKGCRDPLLEDPGKYLAKLKN